jgi:hypothetical protein
MDGEKQEDGEDLWEEVEVIPEPDHPESCLTDDELEELKKQGLL